MPPRLRFPPTANRSNPSSRTRSQKKDENPGLSLQSKPVNHRAVNPRTIANDTVDMSEEENSTEFDIESETRADLPVSSPLTDDPELQEFAPDASQAAVIAQLGHQLEEAERKIIQSEKRARTSSVLDVLEEHRAKKTKTTRSLPDATTLREKMSKQYLLTHSVASSNASSPSTHSAKSSFGTSAPGTPTDLVIEGDFLTPEPQKTSGLINQAKPKQQAAYSPDHQEVFGQAKRYINLYVCTQIAFPDMAEIRRMSHSALKQANIDFDRSVALTADIESMMKTHIPRWRYRWKSEARKFIVIDYNLTGTPESIQDKVKYLISQGRYLYKQIVLDPNGKERYLRPFGHITLTKSIHEVMFRLQEGPARLNPNLINPIPFEAIALAGVTIRHCLDEYSTGAYKKMTFDSDDYNLEYQKLLTWLSKYEKVQPAHCHELQAEIFTSGMASINTANADDGDFVIDSADELV